MSESKLILDVVNKRMGGVTRRKSANKHTRDLQAISSMRQGASETVLRLFGRLIRLGVMHYGMYATRRSVVTFGAMRRAGCRPDESRRGSAGFASPRRRGRRHPAWRRPC